MTSPSAPDPTGRFSWLPILDEWIEKYAGVDRPAFVFHGDQAAVAEKLRQLIESGKLRHDGSAASVDRSHSEDSQEQASPWLSEDTWEQLQDEARKTAAPRLTTVYDPGFGAIAQLATADGQLFFGADGVMTFEPTDRGAQE